MGAVELVRGRGRVCEVGRSDPCVSSAAVSSARVPQYSFIESLRTDCEHVGSCRGAGERESSVVRQSSTIVRVL